MPACQCCVQDDTDASAVKKIGLFNQVTVLLITVWVFIVAIAVEVADGSHPAAPSLSGFIRQMVG